MSEITKFAFNIPDDVYKESRSKYAMTKDAMIAKYGEQGGTKKWNEYCKKQALTNTFEYKHQKYDWTKEQFDEYNKSRAVTKENLIRRHGKDKGMRIWNEYVSKQVLTKSKDYVVEKYGIDKWFEINSKKRHTLDNMIRLYGEIEGPQIYKMYVKNRLSYSKISQECFRKLDSIFKQYKTEYASKNHEHAIFTDEIGTIYLDYYVPELKLCIEFNGDIFHGNPEIYGPEDHCFPYDKSITAGELREKDQRRYNILAKKYGITTEIIWESDYKNSEKFDIFYQTISKKYGHK